MTNPFRDDLTETKIHPANERHPFLSDEGSPHRKPDKGSVAAQLAYFREQNGSTSSLPEVLLLSDGPRSAPAEPRRASKPKPGEQKPKSPEAKGFRQEAGKSVFTRPDGTRVEVAPGADGSHTVRVHRPGQRDDVVVNIPKGFQITTHKDGRVEAYWPYGPDGNYLHGEPPAGGDIAIQVNPDGSTHTKKARTFVEVTRHPDGRFHYESINWNTVDISAESPNGRTLEIKNPSLRSGSVRVDIPPNSKVTAQDNGTVVIEQPDGVKVTASPDGTVQTVSGPVVSTRYPDGTVISTNSKDGSKTTVKPDGTKVTEKADHTVVTEYKSGDRETKTPDGTTIYESQDHSKTTRRPDGTTITEERDGKRITKLPDGTVKTEIPYPEGGYLVHEYDPAKKTHKLYDSPEAAARARILQQQLEDDFGVRFSKPGQMAENYQNKDHPTRLPTLKELEVIKSALYRSQPAHKFEGKGVEFVFLDGEAFDGVGATYWAGRIVITPGVPPQWFQSEASAAYRSAHFDDTFESYMVHELAHNSTRNRDPKVFEGNRTALASIYGFRTICDVTQGNQTTWVLLGKHKSDGQDYDMYKKTKGGWIRCDKDGHPIGTKISEEQMRGLALIKPATTYCNNPIEVEAEALTALRLGGATLARFIAECPELYNIVQQRDQEEIDRVYGAGWMRDINGRVVRRTSTSEEEYRQFMAKAQAQGEVA